MIRNVAKIQIRFLYVLRNKIFQIHFRIYGHIAVETQNCIMRTGDRYFIASCSITVVRTEEHWRVVCKIRSHATVKGGFSTTERELQTWNWSPRNRLHLTLLTNECVTQVTKRQGLCCEQRSVQLPYQVVMEGDAVNVAEFHQRQNVAATPQTWKKFLSRLTWDNIPYSTM